MGKRRKASREELLDRLYAKIPSANCQGKCHASCGMIPLAALEADRIERHLGSFPRMASVKCPFLNGDLRCSVYELRPFICRIWGVSQATPICGFGCVPDRVLTVKETLDLFDEYNRIIGGQGNVQVLVPEFEFAVRNMPPDLMNLVMRRHE